MATFLGGCDSWICISLIQILNTLRSNDSCRIGFSRGYFALRHGEQTMRWHDELDAGHGACVLRDHSNAEIVGTSLRHFDGDRYELTDFIVMPNHVHLLAAFPVEAAMFEQCESWQHFTAHQINRKLGQRGRFWQQDGFDHLVRSEEQFLHFRRYIARNGIKAGLSPSEYLHYSKPL